MKVRGVNTETGEKSWDGTSIIIKATEWETLQESVTELRASLKLLEQKVETLRGDVITGKYGGRR